ncbi:DUF977 family protein [Klebsiella pneumoniae]|nr:DUF977 family protein [Klebsiella pneumoniae]UPY99802.1 DUF977 family protein [Klebsiella pneumoniae]
MARAFSAVERREYVRAVIRITRHQGRLTTTEAMKKLGLSRATVQRYFSEAEATGEVVRHGRLGLFPPPPPPPPPQLTPRPTSLQPTAHYTLPLHAALPI